MFKHKRTIAAMLLVVIVTTLVISCKKERPERPDRDEAKAPIEWVEE